MAERKFKGVKKGDIIEVETKAESGHAIVTGIGPDGVNYEPVANSFQNRSYREPVGARQIKGVYRKLKV